LRSIVDTAVITGASLHLQMRHARLDWISDSEQDTGHRPNIL